MRVPVESSSGLWGNVIGIGAFATVVAFWPPWPEAFALPKVMLITALALACTPLVWSRRGYLSRAKAPMILLAAFLVAVVLSQVLSGAPQAFSFWGDWSRRVGTLTTLSLGLVFAAGVVLTKSEVRRVLIWIIGSGVPVTAYGLVQVVGLDPFAWNFPGWITSSLGNPNFTAAGLVILALITSGFAVFGDLANPWRLALGLLAALEVFLAVATGSSQGLFSLAAGLGAGLLVWLFRWNSAHRTRVVAAVTGLFAVGIGLTAAAIFNAGPLVSLVSPDTLVFRRWFWNAGVDMAASHPLLGVGPDGFGRFYLEYRPQDATQLLTVATNAAHNVPLQWAATLGIPAAAAYLALTVTSVVVVVRRLWVQRSSAAALVVPVAAAWVAYQTQSLVSIDAPALALLGWLSWGLLFALSNQRGEPPTRTRPRVWVAAGILGVVGLLMWVPPMVASTASRTVVTGTSEQDVVEAIQLVEGSLLPCEPSLGVVQWMLQVYPSQQTVDALFGRANSDDRCQVLVVLSTSVAMQLKRGDIALGFAQRSVDVDPANFYRWLDLARAQHLVGNDEAAVLSLERALELAPDAANEIQAAANELALTLPGASAVP